MHGIFDENDGQRNYLLLQCQINQALRQDDYEYNLTRFERVLHNDYEYLFFLEIIRVILTK